MGAPMDVERRARRPCSDKPEELGPGGDKKPAKTARPSPEDAAAPKPKETPERAKKSSTPPPEDVGALGSVEASPVRDAPTDELGTAAPPPHKKSKKKKNKKKKRKRRPPPPSQKVRAQEEVDSGDPSLVRKVPVDASVSLQREIVASLDHNKRDATPPPKRAKRGATPQQEEEEQAEKRAAGADVVEIGKTLTETCVPADKVNHKKKLWKVLAGPPHPDSTELGLTGNREEALDACNTSSPEEDSAQEEEQQGEEKMVEQDHDGITSLLQVNDDAHKDKQQGEEVAEQEHAHNASLPQQNDSAQEVEHTGVEVCREALWERNLSSPKLCTSEGEKKPAVERSWSQDDELKILTALVEHAQTHGGALPDSSDLLVKLTFDKTDANADKLNDKIRKLRTRYRRLSSQGRPTDHRGRRLFELSEVLWGQVDDDGQAEATFVTRDREFSQRSSLYPYLAEEVKVYAEKHSSGNSIMAAFTTIADDKARLLDAMCKKQRVDAFNLELSQAKLTNAVLSAFSNLIN
ncbi:unnamed protein product [Urochloa decumbens]|uniref:Glabrous enhancer-binding protein-like DBD domain-containing protein n=1 Tax=Urochloa decumbens TaxID=240449 RepID=A0ABC9D8S3_9POAL